MGDFFNNLLDRIDLIKIDVEGMEVDVLRGAADSLARFKPIMLIGHHKSDVDVMTGLLRDLGYRIYNPGGMNLLAVHADDRSNEHIGKAST